MPDAGAHPVVATCSVLAAAESSRAGELLEQALDVPRPAVQQAAAEALLSRQSPHGRLALFRRLENLPTAIWESVHRASGQLSTTFRQLLLQGSPDTRALALKAIRLTRQYLQLGHVLELVNQRNSDASELAVDTLRSLVNQLYDEWQGSTGTADADLQACRTSVLNELQKALANWDAQARPEELIEAVLILAEPQHVAVKQVLWHGSDICREKAANCIMESRHPGVIRLAAESLLDSYPHPKIFVAIRTRHDPEFLSCLLTVINRKRSAKQLEQLRQVQSLDWLVPPYDVLESIPPTLQPALIAFVNATRIDRQIKAGVQEWMLRFGTPEGKRAATSGLSLIDEGVIHEVVRESLDSEDAGVQAWATSQLRQHAIPAAFELLVERLDSPLPEVRDAARAELAGFSVPRVLLLAEELPSEDARRSGILLMKVDQDASAKIRRLLAHPIRQKRIQAARQVARLGLQQHFVSAFAAMAQDSDPFARRTAAQILATIPDMAAYRALAPLVNDSHPRVQETAAEAIQDWNTVTVAARSQTEPLFEPEDQPAADW